MSDRTDRSSTARLAGLAVVVLVAVAGCVTTGPKFSPEVQQSYRHHDMHKMVTDHLEVYYPDERREEARRIAAGLEDCFLELEDQLPDPVDWGPVPVFLPEVEFNNAYAAFGAGNKPHIVVPTFFSANVFGQFGYTPSPSAVGCHEMVHYVHLTQVHDFYRAINALFGPTINPQIGLDLWFFEGLATYYESKLVEDVGRHGSPIWDNVFGAGITTADIDGGLLSQFDREVPFGAHYLVGSYFVAYLVEEYGEQKLWQLIDRQGRSVGFVFGVSSRFEDVYGVRLGELIEEFEEHVRDHWERRRRPEDQQVVDRIGRNADFEVGPGGRTALFSGDLDEVSTIEIFDGDGDRLLERRVPDVLPGRQLVAVRRVEAMRFSPDGRTLYFIAEHRGRDEARTSLMGLDIENDDLEVVRDDLRSVGGDVAPTGDSFVSARADGDRVVFERLGLGDGTDESLFGLPPGAYVGWVRVGPGGDRLAVTLMEDEQWSVAVLDIDDGRLIERWATDRPHHPVFDPYWLDDERLVFAGADDGRIQVFEGRVGDPEVVRHTDVPYMAYNPRPVGDDRIRFLNRDGWGWTLDEVEQADEPSTGDVQRREEPPGAEVAGYREPDQPVEVYEDEPYSKFDGLFVPRLRAPMLLVGGLGDQIEVSMGMAGRDELGFHNWMVDARWDFGEQRLSGSLAYVNTQLAPWFVTAEVANQWLTTAAPIDGDPTDVGLRAQRDRFARLEAARPIYDMSVFFEGIAADFLREQDAVADEQSRRLVGAETGASYQAHRATRYGGAQWLLGLSGRAGGYPTELGSEFSMAHLRSQIDVHTPLPVSNRHRLRLSGRIRSLPGAPEDEELMRVGGFTAFQPLMVSRDRDAVAPTDAMLPRGFLFVESLRGYEDAGLTTNHIGIADLDYRYPVIVDRGTASTLRWLPAVYLRELDLQAFATAAGQLDGTPHGAVGAAVDVSFAFWRLPLRLRNQVAHRLFDDRRTVFTLSLGAGFGF